MPTPEWRAYVRSWYARNKDRIAKRRRGWLKSNPDRVASYNAKRRKHYRTHRRQNIDAAARWKREHPERREKWRRSWYPRHYKRTGRDWIYRTRYGISLEEYERLLKKQRGRCAICHRKPSSKRRLCVDHCHRTKRVRGLLCIKCNVAMGLLGDSVDLVSLTLRYLKKHHG